jgi:hypothetical protein
MAKMSKKMKFMKRIAFLTLLCFFSIQKNSAQAKSENNNIWFHYLGKNIVNKEISFTVEASMRYANGFSEKQQWFVRPSLDYQFTKSWSGNVGYAYYNTYSYGDPAINKTDTPEHHIWVQGTYVHNSGNFKFTHRLRGENRLVGIVVPVKDVTTDEVGYTIDHYDYRNRLRYMFLINYPLIKVDNKIKLFTILGDEVFMNIGKNTGKTFLNQNRIIAGLGYNFNFHHQVQLSYIHQKIWNFKNTIQETNPTMRVSYITNFNL